jgi:hypothetical protein
MFAYARDPFFCGGRFMDFSILFYIDGIVLFFWFITC